MARITVSTLDRLSKRSSMTFGAEDGDVSIETTNLTAALDAVILGAAARAVHSVDNVYDIGSAIPPADEHAERNNKWLFRVQDGTTGMIYTHEIGTADNSALPAPTTDFLDLTAGLGLALKTAWDVLWRSPQGNDGALLSVQQVNRAG